MQTPISLLPDSRTLDNNLKAVLHQNGVRRFSLVGRKRPRYMSTFPNEIVTCRTGDGNELQLFIKYEADRDHRSFGHRGGLNYEAKVYERVLRTLEWFRPEFIGSRADKMNGSVLVLEHLKRCTRLKDIRVRRKGISQSIAMVEAARWLGRFHSVLQQRTSDRALSFLHSYDEDYYKGWVHRAWEYSKPLHKRFPWLQVLCRESRGMFTPLLKAPRTVIHGEFYINNILVRQKNIFPIDWESAAIAPGEIDLAALTEGPWRSSLIKRCEQEYKRSRWPDGATDFERVLDTARLYLYFRWLGECEAWAVREKTMWRYDHLHRTAKRLGLL